MRTVLIFGAVVFLLSNLSFWYVKTAHLCPVPIAYSIGTIDERFGLTQSELGAIAAEAEALWERKVGNDLFVYDERTDFSINLIYDERQQLASTEEEWRVRLDEEERANEAQIAKVKEEGEAYSALQADYEAVLVRYESRLSAYNNQVATHNEAGGAPKEEYAKLQTEAAALADMQSELLSQERALRAKAEAINELGERANADIAAYNAEVLKYNEVFGNLEAFTQGDFERERINVYKFSTKEELTAVLAHEFGHALGLGHVEDESAIMYYLMTDRDTSEVTNTDVAALAAICDGESPLARRTRYLIRSIINYFNF